MLSSVNFIFDKCNSQLLLETFLFLAIKTSANQPKSSHSSNTAARASYLMRCPAEWSWHTQCTQSVRSPPWSETKRIVRGDAAGSTRVKTDGHVNTRITNKYDWQMSCLTRQSPRQHLKNVNTLEETGADPHDTNLTRPPKIVCE